MKDMQIKHLYNRKPCADCPFTIRDVKVFSKERAMHVLSADSFVCHKTIGKGQEKRQCAGHMIIKGNENSFVAVAEQLGIELELCTQSDAFSKEEFINYYS